MLSCNFKSFTLKLPSGYSYFKDQVKFSDFIHNIMKYRHYFGKVAFFKVKKNVPIGKGTVCISKHPREFSQQ